LSSALDNWYRRPSFNIETPRAIESSLSFGLMSANLIIAWLSEIASEIQIQFKIETPRAVESNLSCGLVTSNLVIAWLL
jgi:hypothetical protein